MKKKVLLSLIGLITLTSCSNYSFDLPSHNDGTLYEFKHDEGMILDGKATEDVYQNLETFDIYEPQYNVTVSTKTYFGEHGFYFMIESDDTSVFANKEFDIYTNDGIEMHICVDPDSTTKLENLKKDNRVDDTMIQIRTDVSGRLQTWVGNYMQGNYYEWTLYYIPCEIATYVDGKMNRTDGANGFGIEIFLPYDAMNLTSAPEKISIMPAFNNSSSNLDAERKWFTYKGMSHNLPSSWINVNNEGYHFKGKNLDPLKEITGSSDDLKFIKVDGIELFEVNSRNKSPELRGTYKAFLDERGIYSQFLVFDKELSQYSDVVWANDGVEFYIDTVDNGNSEHFKTGVFRFGFDIDNGIQTDKCMDGFNDSYPHFIGTYSKTSITEISEITDYGYKYLYVYECFIPYESIGLKYEAGMKLKTSFAINSPGESTYILDRKDGSGNMEPSGWLWVDKHYPKNCNEYYTVTEKGVN